jgi:hypothetical protein
MNGGPHGRVRTWSTVDLRSNEIRLDTARMTDPVPLHRGAVKALDDLGAAK